MQGLAPDFSESKGRALQHPVGILRRGDRLEPSRDVPNPMVNIKSLPVGLRLHFHRPTPQNRLVFWSPLLFKDESDDENPIEPEQLVGDVLHTIDGGCCQFAAGPIFKLFYTKPEVLSVSTLGAKKRVNRRVTTALGHHLNKFFSTDGKHLISRVDPADLSMRTLIGTDPDAPCVDAKAYDSRCLFYFSVYMLGLYMPEFQHMGGEIAEKARLLKQSGNALVDWLKIINGHGPIIPPDDCAKALLLAKRHVATFRLVGACKPKHHAFIDLTRRIPFTGNPRFLTTYPDETMNQLCGLMGRPAYRARFALSVIKRYILGRLLQNKPF